MFASLVARLRGTRKGLAWYCEATQLDSIWRQLANIPTCVRECDDGVQLFLRLHRQCWDYSIIVKTPVHRPKPKISVLLPAYNRANCLPHSICSVLTQTLADFELIVVDDASTDCTCEVLSRFSNDPRVRVFVNPENRGLARCLNKALDVSTSQFVVHLDSDDTLVPTALERLYAELRTSGAGAVYSSQIRRTRDLGNGNQAHPSEQLLASLDYTAPRAYRAALLRKIGGWSTNDAHEGRYFEDRLMLARVSEQACLKSFREALCVVSRTPDSLSSQTNASSAKFAIVTHFANSRERRLRILRKGKTLLPSFVARGKPVPNNHGLW
jgi:glycosyltransferase involved in cell wall biosynthesis